MRNKYWTCSKFADKLRGTKKLGSGTAREWKEWEEKAKTAHPIRYWLAEEGLDKLQKFIYWPLDKLYDMKYYVVNRWIDQSHALVAHPKHIKPGQYRDFSERILICLFDELVDFVEIEKAYSNYRWDEEKRKGMKWWQVGRWRTRTWRSAEAGLDHLEWESSLGEEGGTNHQAEVAKEVIELYTWWTQVYQNRPDPMDVSGWSAYCNDRESRGIGFMEDDPEEDRDMTVAMHDKMREVEEAYDAEDTEMLIRLIKIRRNLWT